MYSSGFRSHAVVLIRRYGLLVSIRYDPLQNPAGLAPPSPLPQIPPDLKEKSAIQIRVMLPLAHRSFFPVVRSEQGK